MAFYETVFIARQDLTPAQTTDLANQFAQVVNDNGGKVERIEHWGLRQLAYKINKNKKGNYVLFHISGNPSAIKEMERLLRLNEDVMRFLTVAYEEMPKGPTVMMQEHDDSAPVRGRPGASGRFRKPAYGENNDTAEGEE